MLVNHSCRPLARLIPPLHRLLLLVRCRHIGARLSRIDEDWPEVAAGFYTNYEVDTVRSRTSLKFVNSDFERFGLWWLWRTCPLSGAVKFVTPPAANCVQFPPAVTIMPAPEILCIDALDGEEYSVVQCRCMSGNICAA